jgi:O-methyltransferase involved in polyketide biosynthesis
MIRKFPKGSALAFTYVLRDLIEGKNLHGFEKGYEQYIKKEKIWKLGYNKDEIPLLLEKYNLEVKEDKSFDQLGEKYILPLNRNLEFTEIERVAFCVKV